MKGHVYVYQTPFAINWGLYLHGLLKYMSN